MYPEISLFGITIQSYDLMAAIGALAVILLARPALRRTGLSAWGAVLLPVGMGLAFLVGARLWNVMIHPRAYENSFHWYTLKMAGFSFYGGLVGALIVLLVVGRIRKLNLWKLLDSFVIPAGVGFCIARIGCFLAGCCGGKETDSIFGVVFPSEVSEDSSALFELFVRNRAVHPTQLYELFGAALGIGFVLVLERMISRYANETYVILDDVVSVDTVPDLLMREGERPQESVYEMYGRVRENIYGKMPIPGTRFLLYGSWFSLMRFLVLPFRELNYPRVVTTWIYPILYLGLAAGLMMVLYIRERRVVRGSGEKQKENPGDE